MSAPMTPCCVASLNQQREQAVEHHKIDHQKQCSESAIAPCKQAVTTYTTIENGKVVVKPMPPIETHLVVQQPLIQADLEL